MGVIATLILTTFIAGVIGTGLGGLIGALLQKDSNRTVSLLLSFAGGVMLSVVCFDLVVEAIETQVGILAVILAVAATPLGRKLWYKLGEKTRSVLVPVFMMAALILCTASLVDASYNPFLYFRF